MLKGNKYYNKKSKTFDSIWIIKEANKITAWLDVKLNKQATLYHAIQGLINMNQGKSEPNESFEIRFDNVYNTMEIAGG